MVLEQTDIPVLQPGHNDNNYTSAPNNSGSAISVPTSSLKLISYNHHNNNITSSSNESKTYSQQVYHSFSFHCAI